VSFQWTVTPEQAFGDLTNAYIAAIRRGIRALADRRAPEIEAWMKSNAVWTDRTSNARQSLYSDVEQVSLDMVHIILAYGATIDYAIYLELANAGRFSIITPALDYWGPQIWRDVQAMLS
jgi:hypothetical protein